MFTSVLTEEGSSGRVRDPAPSVERLREVTVCGSTLLVVSPVSAGTDGKTTHSDRTVTLTVLLTSICRQ